jgi:hypothetical protein
MSAAATSGETVEYRRILLAGSVVDVVRDGDELVAGDGRRVSVRDAVHLPPVVPSKIVAVHLNHVSRVNEFQISLPLAPTYFHKPTSSLNAHDGAVVRPAGCKWLNYEGEVAIVIGRTARNIAPQDAGRHIAGYTIANDYGLHDFRDTDAGSMLRVKGSDTLCPHDHPAARRRPAVRDAGQLAHRPPRGRRGGPGRGPGSPAQSHRRGSDADPRRCRGPAERIRRGAVHRARRRLGVPRDPGAGPSVTVTLRADSSS